MLIERNEKTVICKIEKMDLNIYNLNVDDFTNGTVDAVNFIWNLATMENISDKVNYLKLDTCNQYPIIITFELENIIADTTIEDTEAVKTIKEIISKRKKTEKTHSVIKTYVVNNFSNLSKAIQRLKLKEDLLLYRINKTYYIQIKEELNNLDVILNEYDINIKKYSTSFLDEHCDIRQKISVKTLVDII